MVQQNIDAYINIKEVPQYANNYRLLGHGSTGCQLLFTQLFFFVENVHNKKLRNKERT